MFGMHAEDLAEIIGKGQKACICILKNGRGHNIVADKVTAKGTLRGVVGLVRQVCLYEMSPGRPVLLVDDESVVRQTVGNQRVLLNVPIIVLSKSTMGVSAEDISLIETPDCPVLERDPHIPGGSVDEVYVAKMVPELEQFRLPNGGFSASLAAAALSPVALQLPPPQLPPGKMIGKPLKDQPGGTNRKVGDNQPPRPGGPGGPPFVPVAYPGVPNAQPNLQPNIQPLNAQPNRTAAPLSPGMIKRVPLATSVIDRFRTQDEFQSSEA